MVKAIKYNNSVCNNFERPSFVVIEEIFIPSVGFGFNKGENNDTLNVFKLDNPNYAHANVTFTFLDGKSRYHKTS